jgi:hypothetical protein
MLRTVFFIVLFGLTQTTFCQTKILFDATKAQTAGQADWVVDADQWNLNWNPNAYTGVSNWHSNAQRIPTNSQTNITASTSESYWTGGLSYWGVDCAKKGYIVETLPYNGQITFGNSSNPQDLSNYKVYIICEPNILFTTAEKKAIIQFVQSGGGLFLVSDHTISDRNGDGDDSPVIINDLFTNNTIQSNPFGVSVDLQDISGTSTSINAAANDSIIHGPMGNVTQVKWSSGTTLTINPAVNSSVKGVIYKSGTTSGNNNVLFAYSRFGKGKMAIIGDSSPCDDGTGNPSSNLTLYDGYITDASGNHQKLLMNATIWLAASNTVDTIKATITTTNPTTFCDGDSAVLTSNVGLGYQYKWKLNGQVIAGATQSSYVAKAAGIYSVTINDTANSNSITINVNPSPIATISATIPAVLCNGDTVVLSANSGTGITYQWIKDNANIPSATSISYKAYSSGIYQVRTSNGSCSRYSSSQNILFNNKPTKPTITKIGSTTNGYILSTDVNNSYQWLLNNSLLSGKTKQLDTALISGNYRVIVSNSSGCSDTSIIFNVDLSKINILDIKNEPLPLILQVVDAQLKIIATKTLADVEFSLFNNLGQLYWNEKLEHMNSLDAFNIPIQQGIQYLMIRCGDHVYYNKVL